MTRLASLCGALAIALLLAGCRAKSPMGVALRSSTQFENEWGNYLKMAPSKALAVAGDVTTTHVVGYAHDAANDELAVREAMAACKQRRDDRRIEGACWLYAVNEEISITDTPTRTHSGTGDPVE